MDKQMKKMMAGLLVLAMILSMVFVHAEEKTDAAQAATR